MEQRKCSRNVYVAMKIPYEYDIALFVGITSRTRRHFTLKLLPEWMSLYLRRGLVTFNSPLHFSLSPVNYFDNIHLFER